MMWNYSVLVTVSMRTGTQNKLGGAGCVVFTCRIGTLIILQGNFKLHVKREWTGDPAYFIMWGLVTVLLSYSKQGLQKLIKSILIS